MFIVTSNEFNPSNGFDAPRFSTVLGVFTTFDQAKARIDLDIKKRITPVSFIDRHETEVVLFDEEPTLEQLDEPEEMDRIEYAIQTITLDDPSTDVTVFNM